MRGILANDKAKIVLVIALFAIAGGIVCYQVFRPGPLSDDINFICVATGAKFSIDRADVSCIPETNPDTGAATLVPCSLVENGVLKVNPHYRSVLEELGQENRYVDMDTLTVKTEP